MESRLLVAATFCLVQTADAAPLDEALALVLEQSPVVAEARAEASAVSRQSDWSSRVRLGYNHYQYTGAVSYTHLRAHET